MLLYHKILERDSVFHIYLFILNLNMYTSLSVDKISLCLFFLCVHFWFCFQKYYKNCLKFKLKNNFGNNQRMKVNFKINTFKPHVFVICLTKHKKMKLEHKIQKQNITNGNSKQKNKFYIQFIACLMII